MGKLRVTDFFIYRWRYQIGYSITIIVFAILLLFAGLFVPGGITTAEMSSVVTSASSYFTHFTPDTVINLPYHLLQHASLSLFGVTILSIKLPSLLIALGSAIGMFLLLRQWFSRNVALFSSAIMIASGQFLIVAQSGTPSIAYIFFSVWLLLAATMVTRAKRTHILWKASFFLLATLSLYTPLSIYALVALGVIGVVHPHIRHILKHLPKVKLLIMSVLSLVLLTPLGIVLSSHPDTIRVLLGIPKTMPDIWHSGLQLLTQYLDFTGHPTGTLMVPIFGLGAIILIVFGILTMFSSHYTARSYTIMAWLVLLIPVLLINPNLTTVLFTPMLLLLTMGLQALVFYWYHLFPRNPYARVAGLIPLVVLVSGLVVTGVDRYVYGYYYDPGATQNFSQDVRILSSSLAHRSQPVKLVVSASERPFYDVVAKYHHNIQVSESLPLSITQTTYVSHTAHSEDQPVAQQILISDMSDNADRFYVYKKTD